MTACYYDLSNRKAVAPLYSFEVPRFMSVYCNLGQSGSIVELAGRPFSCLGDEQAGFQGRSSWQWNIQPSAKEPANVTSDEFPKQPISKRVCGSSVSGTCSAHCPLGVKSDMYSELGGVHLCYAFTSRLSSSLSPCPLSDDHSATRAYMAPCNSAHLSRARLLGQISLTTHTLRLHTTQHCCSCLM